MLVERTRNLILGIMLGLLAACGGGGGDAGTSVPLQGALALTISGLPSGVAAQVSVTGPAGFSQAVTASQTLNALNPGSYTVIGARVIRPLSSNSFWRRQQGEADMPIFSASSFDEMRQFFCNSARIFNDAESRGVFFTFFFDS